jgi:hypothetical protein
VALAAAASLGWSHRVFARFDRATRPLDQIIAHVPLGSRVAAMVYDPYAPGLRLPVYLHLGGYVLAERGGMASSGFTRTGISYAPSVPLATLLVNELWAPSRTGWRMDLERYGRAYDWVLVRRGPRCAGSPFLSDQARGVLARRALTAGEFELWRLTPDGTP